MKTARQILFFGMLLLLPACVTLYKPNVIHSPQLKEKGDNNTSAVFGILGSGFYNLQSSYALSDHTAVMGDIMYHHLRIISDDNSDERLNIFSAEAGAGYFKTFGDMKNGLLQCYGGMGLGGSKDIIEDINHNYPEADSRYFNIFLQPGIGYVGKSVAVSFDLRANYIDLYNIHAYMYDQFEWWNTQSRLYSDTTLNFVNLEPAITFRFGKENLRGFLQTGMTVPVINARSYLKVNTENYLLLPLFKFSFGVSYTFGRKKQSR
jgi:hypothetical protein